MHLRAQTIPFYHLQRLLSPSLRLSPTPAPSIHLSLSPSRPISFHGSHAFSRVKKKEREREREKKKLTNSKKETSFFFAIFKREISRFHGPSMNGTIVKSDRIDSIHETIPNSFPFLPPLFFCSIHHLFFFFFFFFTLPDTHYYHATKRVLAR